MNKAVVALLVLALAAATGGCRLRTIDPDEYKPDTPGHLNPVEARQLISRLFARHNIKLAYNAKLNLRGVKIDCDGYDFNLGIGYVYLIRPPEGMKVNFEIPKPPTAEELKVLEKIEKTEHTFVVWVNEGTEESIAAEINAFVEKLYKVGALARYRGVEKKKEEEPGKDKEGGEAKAEEKKEDKEPADEPKKKKEKSKVMKMIEDDEDKKEEE